ncbi:MAG TPA: DUF3089 domain-containing protein [Sphingomicrobium sp.]|nr:DUF3089 domain-containing protein [Sphingomicrobium sp.]
MIPAILLAAAVQGAATGADYGNASSWLCLPGRRDVCSTPLPTTALTVGGYGSTGLSKVAKDPPVDCFYVYPTVSSDEGLNSDLAVKEEIGAAQSQFARYASVCRPFAPIYRQMTLGAVAAAATGADLRQEGELAFSDVSRAWKVYFTKYNKGRPFVLVGHSQGSLMLQELIKREIEGKPVARQMVRAVIPGYNVYVPQGKRVGGTFKATPLCSSGSERGCVMTWVSFREKNVPPQGAIFGYAPSPGMTVACTNPVRPGSTAWEVLDSYFYARSTLPVPGGPIRWSTEGPPPTPYVRAQGLVAARCVNGGQRGYLSVRTIESPGGKRTNRIGGEVGVLGMFIPGWGMHLADMSIAQGDVIRTIGELTGQL